MTAVPLLTPLDGRTSVAVVLPAYASPGDRLAAPVRVGDPEGALRSHLRGDWLADPRLNQRHLTRVGRGPAALAADGARLVAALAARAPVLSWHHHGDPAPLLDHLDHLDGRRAAVEGSGTPGPEVAAR